MQKFLLLFSWSLFRALCFGLLLFPLALQAKEKIIIGYLPLWKEWNIQDIQDSSFNVLQISFLSIKHDQVFLEAEYKEKFKNSIEKLQAIKKKNPNLQIVVSIGGWGVDGFSHAASNKRTRKKFAKSIISTIQTYNLDGIDLDWEFPVHGGGNIIGYTKDKENLTLLLAEIRNELDKIQQKNHKLYSLSVAVSVAPWVVDTIEFKNVLLYADYIGLMAYNLAGGWGQYSGHHAPLFRHDSNWATSDIVTALLQEGVDSNQIIFGIPFYGRYLDNVPNVNHGLHQPFSGTAGISSLTYQQITTDYLSNPNFKRYYDKRAKAEFLYSKKQQVFITYMGPKSLKEIMKYVNKQQLLGIMIWEITQDDENKDLTNLAYKMLK